MGAWKSKTAKNEMWFVVAPGSPNYPVGVIPLMWNDQLGISLRIHPSILGKREIAKKVASRFHQQLLSLISTSSKSVNSDSASANIESADSESAQPTPGSFIYPSSGDNSQSASTQI